MRASFVFCAGMALASILGLAAAAARAQEGPNGGAPLSGEFLYYPAPASGPDALLAPPDAPATCPTDWKTPVPTIKDQMWVQFLGGELISPTRHLGPTDVPRINLAPADLRLGVMVDGLCCEQGPCRGATEAILDLFGDSVVRGPGNVAAGASFLLRYNFVQPNCRFVPYIQAGGGILFNDIYKDHTQNAVGQVQEFALDAAVGFHYLVHPNWSIDLEADYFHISNAGMSTRNAGLNAIGGMVGITYYFHKIRKF
jgi:hypothetical protein